MSRLSVVVSTPLALLHLPQRVRLGLVGGSLALLLGFLWMVFPTPPLDFLLLVPLLLASWLFRWRGGGACLGVMAVVVFIHSELLFGRGFWFTTWGLFLLTRILAALFLVLVIAGLRQMTDALLAAQLSSKQARLLSESKDQVLYSLSHELRTPLTQVLGYLDLLEKYGERLDAATQAQYLTRVRGGCEEMLDLLTTALETARTPRNARPLHVETFEFSQEVKTVLAHFSPQVLEQHPVTLAFSESLQVSAEPRFVRQILRNLLTNAFTYTPAQMPIVVKAFPLDALSNTSPEQADTLCVQVIDVGPGIPPISQPLLFQPFVRLSNASGPSTSGTGLGLAICKQLVEAMGGRIWVESSGRAGEGCCFSFTVAYSGEQT